MRRLGLVLVCLIAVAGCDDDDDVGGSGGAGGGVAQLDGGVADVGPDGAVDFDDLGVDAAVAHDLGTDAALVLDLGVDAAEPDAEPDAESDAEPDAESDAGPACDEGAEQACPEGCATGTQTCTDGAWADCVYPDEICNGVDDDCDGAIDEDADGEPLEARCYAGPNGTEGVGLCTAGSSVCRAGVFEVCEGAVVPAGEICDGQDNDCNGTVDDLAAGACVCAPGEARACYTGPNGTEGVGVCAAGVEICTDDGLHFGACQGAVLPSREICDGVDNDCNGEMDDGLLEVDRLCATGEGACRGTGRTFCDGEAGEILCDAEAGAPQAETCDGVDNDCDGAIDVDPIDANQPCSVGIGACQASGDTVCAEGALSCDAQPLMPSDEVCNDLDDDCDGDVDEDLNCQVFRSCAHALEARFVSDGVYQIQADPEVAPQSVWCDQTTDGGGWTLVGSTLNTTLNDQASDFYADLGTLAPSEGHAGIWGELVGLGERWDVRFACRAEVGAAADPMTVDLTFYDVNWYSEFVAGTDQDSCFSESNGAGADSPAPARRDNVAQRFRRRGAQYNAGYLEGEDSCGDTGDFTVDFDDRGQDSDQSDGTDWGEDDSAKKCGVSGLDGGQWFVFVRERPRVAVVGIPSSVVNVLRADGILAEHLNFNAELIEKLSTERYDTIVIGRYASDLGRMTQEVREALAIFGRNGGNVVTEWDGASVFMQNFDRTYRYANTAPDQLGWFAASIGEGGAHAADTPLTLAAPNDPIFDGVPDPIQAGTGTEFFFSLADLEGPSLVLGHEVLATFEGNTENFPNPTYAAITRGRYCGGQFISANFDWSDSPTAEGFGPLVVNMVRNASTPPPADLVDACPVRTRPNYGVCGTTQEDPSNMGIAGRRIDACVADSTLQAMFVTRNGQPNAGNLETYVRGGGIVITEYSSAHLVYNLVFNGDVAQAERFGDCQDNIMPVVQANPHDGFWQDNLFEPTAPNETGCGFDLGAFPGLTKLGGWTTETTQIAYRDLGAGRVWFVAADWQDGAEQSPQSNGLMRYMATHSGGGLYGRGGLASGVIQHQDIDVYLDGNFQPCLAFGYDEGVSFAEMQAACTGNTLVMACRQDGSASLQVSAMGARSEVFRDVGDAVDAVHGHNGVGWYYSAARSMGFAPGGEAVSRNSCDTLSQDRNDRVCWHTGAEGVNPGWRCGGDIGLGVGWERVMLQRDGDVPVDAID